MALRAASLFAGVGGLDLALRIADPGSETVVYLERDAYAAAALVARMEDKALDQAPIWDDITTFDGAAWRGCVDIVLGGFPCQDLSNAGKRAGLEEGKRSSLWSEMLRVATECGARYIFAENVSAIRSADGRNVEDGPSDIVRERALGSVLRDLAEGGWNAEWLCLRASDVGAPHQRERWFCLAYRSSIGSERPQQNGSVGRSRSSLDREDVADAEGGRLRRPEQECDQGKNGDWRGCDALKSGESFLSGGQMANPEGLDGREHQPQRGSQERAAVGGTGADVEHATGKHGRESFNDDWQRQRARATGSELADAVRCGSGPRADDSQAGDRNHKGMRSSDDGGGDLADAMRRRHHHTKEEICTRGNAAFPPGSADAEAWRRILEDRPWLAPAVESGVRVLADGLAVDVDASRADQLRCCGNGVVPLQAAVALTELFRRIEQEAS